MKEWQPSDLWPPPFRQIALKYELMSVSVV